MKKFFLFIFLVGMSFGFSQEELVPEEEDALLEEVTAPHEETPSAQEDSDAPHKHKKDEYNVILPTGPDQPQPIYFTKDMTFSIGNSKIGFYGFIKLDVTSETRITGNTADVRLDFTPLNSDKSEKRSQTLVDARDSRLGLKIEDAVSGVLMKGAVEADFFTNDGDVITSSSRHLRLRLAYAAAELPSHFFFLAGQYYTLPMHYPEIDMPTRINSIFYPPGCVNSRQPQIRWGYRQYFSERKLLQYEMNGEAQGYNTTGIFTEKGADTAQGSIQKYPLFNAKVTWISEMFKWNVVFSGTKAYVIANELGHRLDTPIWGVTSTAAFYWGNLVLWATGHHYVGLTGLSSNYFPQIALIDADTVLKAFNSNSWAVALRYDFIKKRLWTDVMYGLERGDQITGSSLFSGTALKRIEDFRANLVGAFWKHWQIGIEYERTYVKTFNHLSGLNNQVHLGIFYIWGQP